MLDPHLKKAKHRQITPKNSRFIHIHRRMETFLDSQSRLFNIPYVNHRLKRRHTARAFWPGQKSVPISISPNRFHPQNPLCEARLVTANNKARNIQSFCLKPGISLSPVMPNETRYEKTSPIVRIVPS